MTRHDEHEDIFCAQSRNFFSDLRKCACHGYIVSTNGPGCSLPPVQFNESHAHCSCLIADGFEKAPRQLLRPVLCQQLSHFSLQTLQTNLTFIRASSQYTHNLQFSKEKKKKKSCSMAQCNSTFSLTSAFLFVPRPLTAFL